MTSKQLIDATILTVFAREVLEGSIIIGEYRTIILYGNHLEEGLSKDQALRAITVASLFATALALIIIFAVALPMALMSESFDPTTSEIIEGVSKIVAAVCMMQLSLKLPKWLGVYDCRQSQRKNDEEESEEQRVITDTNETDPEAPCTTNTSGNALSSNSNGTQNTPVDSLTLSSIRFNVAWNIWREVAECGVFLVPCLLTGERLTAIPLSALIGILIGGGLGLAIYYTNRRLHKQKWGLPLFVILLVSFLSAGLFTGGAHNLERETKPTRQVWSIENPFWDAHRMPMTFIKPFGYNSSRTVLEIVLFWSWLALLAVLQYVQYQRYTTRRPRTSLADKEVLIQNNETVDFKFSSDSDTTSREGKMSASSENGSLQDVTCET